MQDHVWTGNALPGPEPLNDESSEAFSAVILGYLGNGEEAEPYARASLAMLNDSGRYVQTGGSQLALARALIRRAQPDPEEAASAARDAILTVDGKEITHGPTFHRATGIWNILARNPDWARLETVRTLGQHVSINRRALPPGPEI